MKWTTTTKKLKELITFDGNPRRMSKEIGEKLKRSIKKFGLVEIPAISITGRVLAGHMRLQVLKDIYGDEHQIEVRIPDRELTEDEEKEYNITSNKIVGEWDYDLLANNFDTALLLDLGFTDIELGMDALDSDLDLENINSNEDREKKFKDELVNCPHCMKSFIIKI